jgi:O-antigen ligase
LLDVRSDNAGRPKSSYLGVAALTLLAVWSVVRAPDVGMAARELATFASLVAVALVVARIRDPVLAPSMLASAASGAYVAVILLIVCTSYFVGARLNRAELFVGYDNYRFFNHVQSAALPLAVLAMTVTPQRTWQHRVAWFAAIGGFALLFAVVGRGTIVGIVVGAMAIGALFGRSSFPILKMLALAATLGLAVFAFVFWSLPLMLGAPSDLPEAYYRNRVVSDESRLFLWRIAMAHVEQSPWLGVGPMHYAHYQNSKAAHPHNIYLQIAAEWGLPMLFLLLGLGGYALRRMVFAIRQCPESRQRNCGVGLFLACIAIAVDGVFSGNFVMPVSQVWIASTFGWAMAWAAGQQAIKPGARVKDGIPAVMRIAALGLVATQLWLVWSAWPEIRHMENHVKQSMERAPNPKMNPRFWSHGWF